MKLPKSWRKLSLRQYLEIDALLTDSEKDPVQKQLEIISLLSGKELEYLQKLSLEEIKSYTAKIDFIRHPERMHQRLPKYFFLKGSMYRLKYKLSTLSAGQYIDLMTFTKEPEEIMANLHNIMAVLALPLFGKYNGKTQPERAQLFYEHLPMSIVYPVSVFFCNLWERLMPAIVDYLGREMRTTLKQVQDSVLEKDSQNTGAGH